MDTKDLRSRIKTYIEQADERLLRIFNAIIEAEEKGAAAEGPAAASAHQRPLSEDEKSREEGIGSLKDDHRLK